MSSSHIHIKAGQVYKNYLRDIWHYRDLAYVLSWRDVKVRYKQTAIGIIWALIRPLFTIVVFTLVFGHVAGFRLEEPIPYILIALTGVLPWQLLSSGITEASASLVGNERLITKVYFPRVLIPASTLLTAILDFCIAYIIALVVFWAYGLIPNFQWLFVIPWLIWAAMLTLGIGLWLSALNVRYRDFRHALPFFIQAGLFISPVGFLTQRIPVKWQLLYQLNPVAGLIDSFRWSVLGGEFPYQSAIIGLSLTGLIFVFGFVYFRSAEKAFADWI